MYRILLNDGLDKDSISKLNSLGFEIVNIHYDKFELESKLKEFDCIVIRSATKLKKDILEKLNGSKLKLIIRAGVGIDNIDIDFADSIGINVRNTPNASSNSVAELVIGHIISVSRFLNDSNYTMRKGQWNKKKYKGTEIFGKTIGIVGMGRIGQSLAKKAEALGMKVVYFTIEGMHSELSYEFLEFEDLLKVSDFVSLHVPYDNKYLIGEKELSIMKEGSYLINCARGKVVDEKALIDALNSGHIKGAGIDVFEDEPTQNNELINNEHVSISPHIGASTFEAQQRIGEEVCNIIKEFFKV